MKYSYSKQIEVKLKRFEEYLKSKKYAIETIRQTRNYTGVYLEWLEVKTLEENEVDYKVFTDFIFQLKKVKTINLVKRIVLAVRHYYDSLELDKNPASGIHIRLNKKSVLNNIIPYKVLIELYDNYRIMVDRDKRNKVILGILIYQGITTGELQKLKVRNVRLKEGKIYIPSCGDTNNRTLDLHANQLLELQEYLLITRLKMMEAINLETDQLFFSERGSLNIKSSLYHMFRSIKKKFPKVSSGKIIRATIIAEWLKTKDVRIVQYMAGHRWVSSTEKYNLANVEALKESLKKHHPLK